MGRLLSIVLWIAVASCGARVNDTTSTPAEGIQPDASVPEADVAIPDLSVDASKDALFERCALVVRDRACPKDIPESMRCVQGGTFYRGSNDAKHGRPEEPVFVQTFLMDATEMSWVRYEACIKAGKCERPIRFPGFMRSTQPAIAMHFKDAQAACAFEGKRLATSVEWERAARGPETTLYPWGDEAPSCKHAHIKDRSGRGCGTDRTRDVGTGTAGHWGIYDLVGNVDEWTADWYAPCYSGCDKACGDSCMGDNPKGPCDGADTCDRKLRVVRGGSWWWPASYASATEVRGKPPHNTAPHRFGVRCVKDLPAIVEDTKNTSDETSTGL